MKCNMEIRKMTGIGLLLVLCFFAGCGARENDIMKFEEATGFTQNENVTSANAAEADASEEIKSDLENSTLSVYICGAVAKPGVYEVDSGTRLVDGIQIAGGFTEDADESAWNLASEMTDGAMYYIPVVGEEIRSAVGAGSISQGGSQNSGMNSGKISLNTATKEQLMTLPGIGEVKADAIISYREANGGFQSPEQVMEIEGIKSSVYEKIKELITV